MELNKKITWEVIKNSVKDRMIESSLIHKFSKSKKYRKSTKSLNKWLENHKTLNYKDYVTMKRLIKKNISKDVIIEEDDSYGEEDYLIAHKKVLYKSKMNNQNKIFNNKDIFTSTPIKVIQKEKEISFTDSDLSQTSTKNTSSESSIFQDNDNKINIKLLSDIQNSDTVPTVEIKELVSSPEQYFTQTKKAQFLDNEEKRFVNNTDTSSAIAKKKSKEASLSRKRNNSFMNDKRTSKEILDLIPDKQEIACHSKTSDKNINSFAVRTKRSPVIISSTEIINNKYIISNKKESCSNLWNKYDDNVKLSQNNYSPECPEYKEEKEENLEEENNICRNTNSNSFLSLSDKHLNQIKKLNLAIESSSSEDEVQEHKKNLNKEILHNNSNCITTEKITTSNKNLFLSVKSSLSKNDILEHKENLSNKKITRCGQNFDLTIKSTTSSEDELLKEQDFNEKINNSNSIASKKTIYSSKLKLKKSSNADHKNDQSISNIQNKNNSINHINSIDHRNYDSKNCEQVQTFHEIPCNLQDLINRDKLVHDTTFKSAFTLEDLSQDNEIFLLNIPCTVQLTGLKGQRFVLKKEKLKLGKNQYKISYKDVPSQSCVFATRKNNKSYKLVNIKPTSSILVREKLSPSSSSQKNSKKNRKTFNITLIK